MTGESGNPPRLLKDGSYLDWKHEVRIWQLGTTVDAKKQAARVILKLEGKAKAHACRLSIEELGKDGGLKYLLDELDKFFKKDETQQKFIAIEELEKYKRSDESISEYIEEFERKYAVVNELLGKEGYDDGIVAYRLLKQASLSDNEAQIIRATIQKLTYENMKAAMKRTLGDVVVLSNSSLGASASGYANPITVKQEPTYFSEDYDEADVQYYANNQRSFRGRGGYYNRGYNNRGSFQNNGRSGYRNNFSQGRGSFNNNNRGYSQNRSNESKGTSQNKSTENRKPGRCLVRVTGSVLEKPRE